MNTSAGSAAPAFARTGPGWRDRVESIPLRRIANFSLAACVVGVGGVVHAVNLSAAPAAAGDEGVLLQRAWTLEQAGHVGQLTDWYDHPPLGWLGLSLWTSTTSALLQPPTAIAAGRSLALVAYLASAVLLWVLARRLGFDRWAAALAVGLFGLTPLAVQLHRLVTLDNLAVPWLVGAFAAAANPRRPLLAFAISGGCLAVASLTNETALVFLPLLVWQLRRSSLPSTRRYGFVIGGALLVSAWVGYVVHAQAHGTLTAGRDHPGLLDGLRAQLVDRPSTGTVFDPDALAGQAVRLWLDLDPIGLPLMLAAAVGALVAVPLLRPFAAAVLVVPVLAAVPGLATTSLLVGALPMGALVVAGLVQHLRAHGPEAAGSGATPAPRGAASTAALGLAALTAAGAIVAWTGESPQLLSDDLGQPARAATPWIAGNVPEDQRLIVDEALWADLAEAGFAPERMAGYSPLDLDPRVGTAASGSWRDYQVVVVSAPLRRLPDRYPTAATALRHSTVVATFGTGADRVELRRIVPTDARPTAPFAVHDTTAARDAGTALARNSALDLAADARDVLVEGQVDLRLMTTLVALAGSTGVQVDAFPADPAERGTGSPRRTVELRLASEDAAADVVELLRAQVPPYRPAHVDRGADRRVTVTYTPAALL